MPDIKKESHFLVDTGYADDDNRCVNPETGRNAYRVPLMQYVPSKPPKPEDVRVRRQYPLDDVVKYIEKLGADWREDKGPRYTRKDLEKVLPARDGAFPGISSTQVREAWEKADLPPAWRVRGRRSEAEKVGS